MVNLSEKQSQILRMRLPLILIVVGVTGSGKSFAANLRVYAELCKLPKGAAILITGNTSESVYKNVVKELMAIDDGIGNLTYTASPARMRTAAGAEAYIVGINAEGADRRLQGGSVELWYADEPTTYPKSAWDMCLSRCRGAGKDGNLVVKPVICTLNPDSDTHWLKTDIVDKADVVGAQVVTFGFSDNPTITREYVETISGRFSGAFRERMIFGRWATDSDDRVLPEMDSTAETEIVAEIERPRWFDWYGAMDPGAVDFTGYLCGWWDFESARLVVEGEAMLRDNTVQIAEAIRKVEAATFSKPPIRRVSDTSIQVIRDLHELHGLSFVPTMKDDKEAAINSVRVAIQRRKIAINPRCTNLVRQIRTARWNKNRTSYERSSTDGHYDLIDCLVYLWRTIDRGRNPAPENDGYVMGPATYVVQSHRKQKRLAAAFGVTV